MISIVLRREGFECSKFLMGADNEGKHLQNLGIEIRARNHRNRDRK